MWKEKQILEIMGVDKYRLVNNDIEKKAERFNVGCLVDKNDMEILEQLKDEYDLSVSKILRLAARAMFYKLGY